MSSSRITCPSRSTMNLYTSNNVRVTMDKAKKLKQQHGENLTPQHLHKIDQLHYSGTTGLQNFLNTELLPRESSRAATILDIGAGVGGPARFMASTYGAQVNAVEYLTEFVSAANEINELCKSHLRAGKVRMIQGDFTAMNLEELQLSGVHDLAVSQLCFLHIGDKKALLNNCCKALKSSGKLYVEDFYIHDTFEDAEHDVLEHNVSVPRGSLNTRKQYIESLESAGFQILEWEEKTSEWSKFVWERCEAFLSNRSEIEAESGRDYYQEKSLFYTSTAKLYHNDLGDNLSELYPHTLGAVGIDWTKRPQRLGGVRYVVVKKD